MKNLNKIVLVVLIIAGFSSYNYAQNGKGYRAGEREGYRKQQNVDLDKLNLTDEHKEDFLEINKKYAEKSAELRKEKDGEIKELLTKEQYESYKELRNERRKRSDMNRQKMECTEQLNLTDKQQSQFREINRKYGQAAKELRENGQSWEENKKAFESIRKEKDAEIKSLLTEEQYEIYLDTHKDCPPGKMGYGKNQKKGKTN